MSPMSQETAFLDGEADAWSRRNAAHCVVAPSDHPVLSALAKTTLSTEGSLLDVGGATGTIAAGFLRDHSAWSACVVEPSREAIAVGQKAFPNIRFEHGSITSSLPPAPNGQYDLVIVSGVFCWVDRELLSRAVANVDQALSDGGVLVIADFDPPSPRANPYHHRPGLFTYKQDYASCFTSLGIYHLEYRSSAPHGSAANPSDPYDRQWMAAVLRKDLRHRYATVG